MKTWIAIDPSINACGVAYCHEGKVKAGTLRPVHSTDLIVRCMSLISKLDGFLYHEHITRATVLIEWPTFQNSERGRMAAVQGDIIKLGCVCGWLGAWLVSRCESVRHVTPQQWKGCLDKDTTWARTVRRFAPGTFSEGLDHNAHDAVALMIWGMDQNSKIPITKKTIVYA